MSRCVALRGTAYGYADGGGGHLWAYLNWALGLQAVGCRVLWVELVDPARPETARSIADLRSRLEPWGLAEALVTCSPSGETVSLNTLDESAVDEADLILDPAYDTPRRILDRAGRSALIDIDPGQLQCWWASGDVSVASHDCYFTIGERIGVPGGRAPDCGVIWNHTPPPVALDAWPATSAPGGGAFTTVTHWYADEYFAYGDVWFDNSKRSAFLPYLDLPSRVEVTLELALALAGDHAEQGSLEARGWRVRDSWSVARTPDSYRDYIRQSLGEFSCVKPSCVFLANAWLSDRTVCFLASGRPAVIQDTGPSDLLPHDEGLLRFSTPDEAASALAEVTSNYSHHARAARRLAEELFDARHVVGRVLERALA